MTRLYLYCFYIHNDTALFFSSLALFSSSFIPSFSRAFLTSFVFFNDPNLSYEILLALLIEEPTPRDRYGSKLNEYTGMTYVSGWFPPFFTRGPFYSFLHAHPGKGLDLIIRLVNFATERWAEDRVSEDREAPHIEIELPAGRRKFVGDANVYYWHRDVGQVSHIIPSALMALEKWLYDAYDKEETKEKVVSFLNRILENGTSLAFIGLLISIGKKNRLSSSRTLAA